MSAPLKVTAVMCSSIAGDPPHLDSILEHEISCRRGMAKKINRAGPPPAAGTIPIPMLRRTIAGVPVACCSSPIFAAQSDIQEKFGKQLSVEHAGLLNESKRRKVPVTGGAFKSFRLPLRVRSPARVVWFCFAKGRNLRKVLRDVHSIGTKRSIGYGRVARWIVEPQDQDYSWFAGSVLMRPLPACDELPNELLGSRPDFGACCPPYWHPDRFMELVVPC